MKKITIIFVLLLVMSTLLFADWGAEANWARAINRWLQATGETSSGTYLSYQQCIDALIDSDGHVNDIYLDNIYAADGILDVDKVTVDTLIVGAVRWDNDSDAIDGEQIADDTIDDDAIDFSDVTAADLTFAEGDITDDTIVEADLKAVDAAADEDFLTYEATTGDFEWHSIADVSAAIAADIATDNAGTINDSVSVVEYGDGHWHKTVITVSTHYGAITGGAALSLGQLVYTFPAGSVIVKAAYMSIALDEDDGNITSDTPDIGIGTTIGSGENATLNAVNAAAENILTGQTANDCNGTAEVKTVADQILVIESGGDHTVYLNIAATWTASGENNLAATGTIVLEWIFVN